MSNYQDSEASENDEKEPINDRVLRAENTPKRGSHTKGKYGLLRRKTAARVIKLGFIGGETVSVRKRKKGKAPYFH